MHPISGEVGCRGGIAVPACLCRRHVRVPSAILRGGKRRVKSAAMKNLTRWQRKLIITVLAAAVALLAWRFGGLATGLEEPAPPPCQAAREEVKDASGQVTEVKRTTCLQ